jgi:hypothetical protein
MRTKHRNATIYDTTTRSTLEARWAIFFRELGLIWQYEPVVLRGKGCSYTPDFHVAGLGYIEIKPTLELFIEESSDRIEKIAKENPDLSIYAFCCGCVSLDLVALYKDDKIFSPTYRQICKRLLLARTKEILSLEAQDAYISRALRIANATKLHSEWKSMKDILPEVVAEILQKAQ